MAHIPTSTSAATDPEAVVQETINGLIRILARKLARRDHEAAQQARAQAQRS
ncbi:hypothetical protein [Azospirillum sp. B510]|uniref:hypothetical protein n=1 Tax=Azospirillum sp. (strain B510) TaxID=137722 RepID=UPI00130544A5|nr:hypothetical protein [Azospirillum sp. B510]